MLRWSHVSIVALAAVTGLQPSTAQSPPKDISLKGILRPSDLTTTLAAECFGTRFQIGTATDSAGNSRLSTFTVDGQEALSTASAASAGAEIAKLSRPYISAVACKDKTTIVIGISGMERDLKGKDEVTRVIQLSSDK